MVYVDAPIWKLGRMKMCHMLADSPAELHAMADKLGIKRQWYQGQASTPHYDICTSKRKKAIELGAKEVTRHELVVIIRRLRADAK